MLAIIERRLSIHKYDYKIINQDRVGGEANHTYYFLPRRIRVTDSDRVLELNQTSYMLKFINSLPILSLETFTPFKLFVNGIYAGKTKKRLFKPIFDISVNKETYCLSLHSNNFISLMKNGVQVALYRKETRTNVERNVYFAKFNLKGEIDEALILLFCVLIDVVFYRNNSRISALKYEKTIVFDDLNNDRVNWIPEV